MGLEIVEEGGPEKTPLSCEQTVCCQCGCQLKTRKDRIRVKDRRFICATCYQHILDPQTTHRSIERVE